MYTFLIALAVIGLLFFLQNRGVQHVNIDQFKSDLQNRSARVIDVRESKEYKSGHIPGAINVPLSQLTQKVKQLPSDKPVYVYCQSGSRSVMATKRLKKQGYDVYNFRGGIMRWDGEITK